MTANIRKLYSWPASSTVLRYHLPQPTNTSLAEKVHYNFRVSCCAQMLLFVYFVCSTFFVCSPPTQFIPLTSPYNTEAMKRQILWSLWNPSEDP